MSRKRFLGLVVSAVLVLLVAASALTWRASAAPDGAGMGLDGQKVSAPAPAEPVPGGPGFYSQSAFAFSPYSADAKYAYNIEELYNPGSTTQAYEAPVSLPNGATVTKLVAYYYDNAASDLSVVMARIALDGSSAPNMASVSPTGQPGYSHAEDTSIDYPLIDLQNYAYVVQVTLPASADVRLVSFRIDYQYGVGLPLVTNEK